MERWVRRTGARRAAYAGVAVVLLWWAGVDCGFSGGGVRKDVALVWGEVGDGGVHGGVLEAGV